MYAYVYNSATKECSVKPDVDDAGVQALLTNPHNICITSKQVSQVTDLLHHLIDDPMRVGKQEDYKFIARWAYYAITESSDRTSPNPLPERTDLYPNLGSHESEPLTFLNGTVKRLEPWVEEKLFRQTCLDESEDTFPTPWVRREAEQFCHMPYRSEFCQLVRLYLYHSYQAYRQSTSDITTICDRLVKTMQTIDGYVESSTGPVDDTAFKFQRDHLDSLIKTIQAMVTVTTFLAAVSPEALKSVPRGDPKHSHSKFRIRAIAKLKGGSSKALTRADAETMTELSYIALHFSL